MRNQHLGTQAQGEANPGPDLQGAETREMKGPQDTLRGPLCALLTDLR